MIGILGGTFDPIHYGHLRPAQEAASRLELAQLRLVVAQDPPHRAAPEASAAQRLRMVEIALTEFRGFVADDREIRRGGPSYTVPTLESLRAEFGERPLCLLLGSDAFGGIQTWYRWERLPALAHLVVMRRPPAVPPPRSAPALPAWACALLATGAADLRASPAGRLLFIDVAPRDIAATRIRAAIARGERPPADWLPPAVWEYIERHRLYRSRAA